MMSILPPTKKIKRHLKNRIVLEIIVFLFLAVGYVHVFTAFVPYDFDEFSQYHALGCVYYPHNMLNTFRSSCQVTQLAPVSDFFLPLRSGSTYLGSPSCLMYLPFFLLWPAPISARLMGLLWLGLQAACLRKLFKTDFLVSYVLLLSFMPYAFIHVFDTGAVHFQTTSVFLIYYLTRRWAAGFENESQPLWRFPVSIGLILFWGLWAKLSYLAVAPAVFCLMVYCFFRKRYVLRKPGVKRRLAAQVLVMMAVASSLSFVLLHSKTKAGNTYYEQSLKSARTLDWRDGRAVREKVHRLGKYFLNPLQAANYAVRVDAKVTPTGIFFGGAFILLVVVGTGRLWLKERRPDGVIINMALAVLTFSVLVFLVRRAHHFHHVVLCFPFLVLALFSLGSRLSRDKVFMALLAVFLAVNVKLYSDLGGLKLKPHNPFTKTRYLAAIDDTFGEGYVFVVLGFGHYFIKHLYGPKDQCVLYMKTHGYDAQIAEIKAILRRLDRKALFIGAQLPLPLKKHFPDLVEHEFNFDTKGWGVWYQP